MLLGLLAGCWHLAESDQRRVNLIWIYYRFSSAEALSHMALAVVKFISRALTFPPIRLSTRAIWSSIINRHGADLWVSPHTLAL